MAAQQLKIRPIIFWEGFPACGLLLKQVVKEFGDNLILTATRPAVPFEGIESLLGHKIIWLENADDIWKKREGFDDRNLIVHTGWAHKDWRKYDAYMKKKNNAKVVVVADNRYRGDLRQLLGAIYFRLFLKKYFDAAFVPGKSSRKLMTFLGMDRGKIYSPNYGAYEEIYKETKPIEERPKEFLFVGQLIKRKGLDILIHAFKEYRKEGGAWTLRILGDGPLRNECEGDGIIREGFAQPNKTAEKMNSARVLVLPSRDDNWGTVICEAAACGMHLITTKYVGASADIVKDGMNGKELRKLDPKSLKKALFYFEYMNESSLKEGSKISKEIAGKFDSRAYYNAFMKFAHDLLP